MMQIVKRAGLSSEKFCYWLQGFIELNGAPPNEKQWLQIKEHLEMVFDHAVQAPDPKENKMPVFEEHNFPNVKLEPFMVC